MKTDIKGPAPEGSSHDYWNLKFNNPKNRVSAIIYSRMEHYMDIKTPSNHTEVDHVYSLVHLKRGIFMSSGSDKKLKVWIPGLAEPNYLGFLEEDHVVSNLTVLESTSKDIKVAYTSDRYLKVLSFEKGQSMIVFPNLTEITSMCVVDQ